MLASKYGAPKSATKNAYVCLSCRLKTQQKRRYGDRAEDAAQTVDRNSKDNNDGANRIREDAEDVLEELGYVQVPHLTEKTRMSLREAMLARNLRGHPRRKPASTFEDERRDIPMVRAIPQGARNAMSEGDSGVRKYGAGIRNSKAGEAAKITKYGARYEIRKHVHVKPVFETQSRREDTSISGPKRQDTLSNYEPLRFRKLPIDTPGPPKVRKHETGDGPETTGIIRRTVYGSANRPELVEASARPVSTPDVERSIQDHIDEHVFAVDRSDAERAEHMRSIEYRSPTAESSDRHSRSLSTPHLKQQTLVKKSPPRPSATFGDLGGDILRKSFSSQSPALLGYSAWRKLDMSRLVSETCRTVHLHARSFHSATRRKQQAAAEVMDHERPAYTPMASTGAFAPSLEKPNGIRAQLRQWQELHGDRDPMPDIPQNDDVVPSDEPVNNLTRLPDDNAIRKQSQQEDGESDEHVGWSNVDKVGFDGAQDDHRFLSPGDLVEIDYTKSERESVLAVYVQQVKGFSTEGQFFTMQGRWMHLPEKTIQYSIPNWVSTELLKPLIAHLPEVESAQDLRTLLDKAYIEDLSVPREVSAPLVKRMLDFYKESQDIYRRHATALDNAHEILSHDTDLRYGSLTSAATTLLQIPANQLPVTALFTVRKALGNGGFAFNMDRRSHRLTGYMQIRSKEQVRMVDNVRNWVRQWQDDMAFTAAKNEKDLPMHNHKAMKGAKVMYGFLKKAKAIVERNRQNRQPTDNKSVGISNVRLPITTETDAVKVHTEENFTDDETEIVRFIEGWCCSLLFTGLPRIESLPPLILHALGLYSDLTTAGGFLFLQELGAIMPWENKIRFDQHLLLPSSQHSKPLQNLMTSLITMRNSHNFVDSMADLRHDWKDLPVFCIDSADAHEIDDGVSVESAGVGPDGRALHWVHIHVANPTAFFSRDHPLAKMARHMGESIYMPERAYMMLPRWATQKYFSLESGRPCMTFSAKLDENGNTVENKITPGIIRNVVSLTPEEIDKLMGATTRNQWPELTLTVGGSPPPAQSVKSRKQNAKQGVRGFDVGDLTTLRMLAEKRAAIRRRAGGIFFDSHKPEVSVWQSYGRHGLSWDHPFRKGIRTVEGDPVIQMKTRGLVNWFAAGDALGKSIVQELMLLAGETAAAWCSARQIPIIYRGTAKDVRKQDPRRFYEENIAPQVENGETIPLHLGIQYIQSQGYTALRTTPLAHRVLGLPAYAKVTSPLRRYGDMIHHWQIEAALRHEAETGRSLVAEKGSKADRSFLPFSSPVLDTIMLGLQPRESIITRSKAYAEHFWIVMLMFRKCVFGEDGHVPFLPDTHFNPDKPKPLSLVGPPKASAGTAANDVQPLRLFIHGSDQSAAFGNSIYGILMELNVSASMARPDKEGIDVVPTRGDVWEVYIDDVDVYRRAIYVKPVRLVGREGAGLL